MRLPWEPAPVSYVTAKKHIEANGLESICHLQQAAVGELDGTSISFSLVSDESTDPTNRIGSTVGQVIQVPSVSLDGELERKIRKPDFVKIDIEGAEILALRGAKNLMSQVGLRPVILLAVHPMFLHEFASSTGDLMHIINDRAYAAMTVDGSVANELSYAEYLLVPNEAVSATKHRVGWS